MPYSFETYNVKLPEGFDRRIKLTGKDKQNIVDLYEIEHCAIREITRIYGVSRRLIQFTLFPERLEHSKELREKRGGWKQYYDKDKNTKAIKEHRHYKYKILSNMEGWNNEKNI